MATRRGSVTDRMMFDHDQTTMTLRQFCEMYKPCLPSFLVVKQGYYGEKEMDVIGNGQVLRIHKCVYQKRAVAVDGNQRTLSIPTSYPIKFRTVNPYNKPSKEEDSLTDILAKKPLPVMIQVSNKSKVSFSLNNRDVQNLGVLTVKELYEETYFLANAIDEDGQPHRTALLIPLYLGDILVAAITGIQGKTKSEWITYQKVVSDACKSVQIPLDTGLQEIALYSPMTIKGSDNVYDYIEPSSYIIADWEGKVESENTTTVTRQDLRKPSLKPKPHRPPKPSASSGDEGREPPKLPLRAVRSLPRQISNEKKAGPPYENDIGRVAVPPFNRLATEAAELAVNRGSVRGPRLPQEEKVKPLPELSIDEVCQSLKDLKLDKHVKTFKEQGVDGKLAAELTDSILQEDFKFSKFDSLKFGKFIQTGHIPK